MAESDVSSQESGLNIYVLYYYVFIVYGVVLTLFPFYRFIYSFSKYVWPVAL